jgi:hypothetical protein
MKRRLDQHLNLRRRIRARLLIRARHLIRRQRRTRRLHIRPRNLGRKLTPRGGSAS